MDTGVIKVDTRSLDHSSCGVTHFRSPGQEILPKSALLNHQEL